MFQTGKADKMHDGCSGTFIDGKQLADKVRMMGFDGMSIPVPLEIHCTHCAGTFHMETMVSPCPACRMVYAVTPCHADNAAHVLPAGIDY
jgi:lipopolysaccharide biosynthesis regulator YciM